MKRLAWVCVATSLALASAASAQSDELWERGVQLRSEHRDAEALEVFQQAHARDRTPRTLAQVAFAEQALGRWAAAAIHLEQALARPDDWITRNRPTIDAAHREIERHVGRVEIQTAAGLEVRVGGVVAGTTPLSAAVPCAPDACTIEVRRGGRAVGQASVSVRAGQQVSATIEASAGGGEPEPLVAIGAVLAGTGAAAGIAMAVVLGVRESDAQAYNSDACWLPGLTRDESCASTRQAVDDAETAALVLGIAGGALVIAGAALLGVGAPSSETASVSCGPGFELGVICRGTF